MNKSKIAKIGISLLIAMAFLMPINAIGNEIKVERSTTIYPETISSSSVLDKSAAPLQFLAEVDAVDIIGITDPTAAGCYNLTVELHKMMLEQIPPINCDIKIFLDIWKQEEPPAVEIACYDFEDVGEIYNNWEAWDGPSGDASSPDGAIDTWSWSDARSCSPSHSMHSSMFDTYLGNQNDYLVLHQMLDEDYTDLKLTFCHWMEGEVLVIDEDGTEEIVDWGKVQYSFDGITWTDISPLYYDNATAETVELNIPSTSGQNDIYIRFYWHSNPCSQFEGWYIDDVCLYGFEDLGWGTRIFDTFTPHAITVDSEYFEYTFDEQYCFEEGEYCIRVWLLSESPDCTVSTPQADPFWYCFEVKDIYDIAVTANSFYLTDSPCLEGGDLMVEGTVCNVGTLDATNVQVTFSVTEQITETVFESLVEESDFSDWVISWQSAGNGSGYTSAMIDLFVTEVDSFSPTHAWTNVNETTGHVRQQYAGVFTPPIDTFSGDPVKMDFSVRIKYNALTNHWVQPAFIADTYLWDFDITSGPTAWNRWPSIVGPASSGWSTLSFSELIQNLDTYWENRYFGQLDGLLEFINALNGRYGPGGLDVEDFTVCNYGVYYEAAVGGSGPGYSGMYLDDFKATKSYAGAERYSKTIIIPFLAVGDCVDVEFVWEGVPTGNFLECKSVPHDDNDDNNQMCGSFSVWTTIDCAIEEYVEAVDLTIAENDWTICTSGYDSYFATGNSQYGVDRLDPLILAPEEDGDETEMDRISIDLSGASQFSLDYMDYFQGESGDYGMIEINPHVSDPDGADYQWYQYVPTSTILIDEDFEGVFPPATFSTVAHTGTATWAQFAYGSQSYDGYLGGSVSNYASASSDSFTPIDSSLYIGPLDLSVFSQAYLDYLVEWIELGGESIEVNTYSGPLMGTFEEQLVDYTVYDDGYIFSGAESYAIDPQSYADPSNIWFEFYFNDGGAWNWYLNIDDVLIYGLPFPSMPAHSNYDWTHQTKTFTTGHLDYFINPQNGNSFADDIGGFTDDMGIAFVFYSDEDINYRGWLIDDVTLMVDSTVLIDADPAEDFDQLYAMPRVAGNYWAFITNAPDYWQCKEQIIDALPNNLNNALVWDTSVPQALAATITFEHNFDLKTNDYCYIEFSTDGGTNWVSPTRFTGTSAGWEAFELDMSSYTGDNVLIRWRVVTNETEKSAYYKVREMCIAAQIDTVPPVTVGVLSGTMIYGWYSSAVTFTATATDDVSGVAATYYKIDGGNKLTYTSPVTISTNGNHQIEYWSVDKVGNEEAHKFTPSFKIDRGAAPTVSITGPEAGIYLFGNKILSFGSKPIIIGGFTVTATASDTDSGVYRLQFSLDGTLFGEDTSTPYSAYCGVKHTGAGTITVVAQDFVGNSAQDTLDITYFKFL